MRGIGHITGQAVGKGLLVDEGPKTYALDDALDSDFVAGFGFLVQIRNPKSEIDSAERLDLSLFGKLKALSPSKGSPTGLVAGRNKFK